MCQANSGAVVFFFFFSRDVCVTGPGDKWLINLVLILVFKPDQFLVFYGLLFLASPGDKNVAFFCFHMLYLTHPGGNC